MVLLKGVRVKPKWLTQGARLSNDQESRKGGASTLVASASAAHCASPQTCTHRITPMIHTLITVVSIGARPRARPFV